MARSIVLDLAVVILAWGFDIFSISMHCTDGHSRWSATAIFAFFLPGLVVFVGRYFEGTIKHQAGPKGYLWNFCTVFFYPVTIVYMGVQQLRDTRGAQLKYFKHMKIYVGLLESSAMFLLGIFVFFSRPQIGHLYIFEDVDLKVPHGKFWLAIVAIFVSFICFIYNITEYHVLSDDCETDVRRQLQLVPYYATHFFFRCFTLATFCIYWREWSWILVIPVMLYNARLTRETYLTDTHNETQHINFCTVVGALSSFLAPCLAVFFRTVTNARNLNYFYKRNILFMNTFCGLLFTVLFFQLTYFPDRPDLNYVRRNVLLSCKSPNLPWTQLEFSPPIGQEIKFATFHASNFSRDEWNSRVDVYWQKIVIEKIRERHPDFYDNETFVNQAFIDLHRNTSRTGEKRHNHYLVSQDCTENETEIYRFHAVVTPIILVLGAVSTSLAFYKFKMNDIDVLGG